MISSPIIELKINEYLRKFVFLGIAGVAGRLLAFVFAVTVSA
jgi:hypothetical protein